MSKAADEERKDFLGRMYDQLFNDINTHILVVWQSVGTLVAAFAVLALVEKAIISIDVATATIVLIAGWLLWHLEDASYWYNRNLVMIANIERQFLRTTDLHDIHYYFGKHRKVGVMIDHLKIQRAFGIGIAGIVLLFHASTRVWSGIGTPWSAFELSRTLPYVVSLAAIAVLIRMRMRYERKYAEFLKNSPGVEMDTAGIEYGIGHPAHEAPAPTTQRQAKSPE